MRAMREPDASAPDARASLTILRRVVGGCTACSLHRHRTNCVFGVGHANADLMFVGEAPGPDEDTAGEPFTGRSGQLLDRIIEAIGSERAQVFLTNVVACRLDDNRNLNKEQIEACRGHLEAQIGTIRPRVIVPLGSTAWRWFKRGDNRAMGEIRGKVYRWRDAVLVPTYHPAFLLRKAEFKRDVWGDVQIAAALVNEPASIRNHEVIELIGDDGSTAKQGELGLFN